MKLAFLYDFSGLVVTKKVIFDEVGRVLVLPKLLSALHSRETYVSGEGVEPVNVFPILTLHENVSLQWN